MYAKRKGLKAVMIALSVIVGIALICYLIPLFCVLAHQGGELHGEPEVMVVFGYKLDSSGMPSLLKSRLDTAITYLEEHKDISVIVSGGKGSGEKMSEAECMYNYLVSCGVDSDRIIVENKSATTVENVRFSMDIIEEMGIQPSKAILVSNEFHLTRIGMLWKRAGGGNASLLASPSKPTSQKAAMYLREPFALLFDFLSAKF